jgi:hypothetical protein
MSWIPGWDAAASAGWWSDFYFRIGILALLVLCISEVIAHRYAEHKSGLRFWLGFLSFWVGIVSLVFLGLSEVVTHRYSERKDMLVEGRRDAVHQKLDSEIRLVEMRVAQAIERAAEAEKEAATLRAALNESRRPRTISPGQRQELLVRLKDQPKGRVRVMAMESIEESYAYARSLADILGEAGYSVSFDGRVAELGYGLVMAWHALTDTPPYARALQEALTQAIDIELLKVYDARWARAADEVAIVVLRKP